MSAPISASRPIAVLRPTPRNGHNTLQHRLVVGDGGLDSRIQLGEGLIEEVDVGQHLSDQEAVVLDPEGAAQRLLQGRDLGPQPALGQLRQLDRIADPGQQRIQYRPPGLGQQRGSDGGQLDAGVLQRLLQPLDHPGPLLDQHPAVAGQIP
jgi:hypothetical protein